MARKIEKIVFELIRNCFEHSSDIPILTTDTKIKELGLDSLKIVEIVFQLENQLQMEADEKRLYEMDTLEDLVVIFEGMPRTI